jgi:hypothetical protein
MSIKESMLNIVSDLAQNDYIRAVTYGGYSRRVEVSELAKSVVEDYTGSSLGGENQSVQGAFSALETEIQNVEQDVTTEINDAILNILPTDTAAGEIASFSDGSDVFPALSCIVDIDPIQDLSHGDPSPDNICPISGRDEVVVSVVGVNWWDEEWENGYLSNSGSVISDANAVCSKNYIPIKQSATYYAVCPSGKSLRICAYKADKTFISLQSVANQTFTLPSGTAYIKWSCYGYGATYANDISINYPSTDHDCHAYTGRDYTIDLGQTVYGATLTYAYADGVASWAMAVDEAKVTIDGNTALQTNGAVGSVSKFFYYAPNKAFGTSNMISDKFTVGNTPLFGEMWGRAGNNGVEFNLPASVPQTVADGQAWFANNPTQLVYKLATPTIIQLTETQVVELFKGYNNVWSDAGDMSVTYKADIQLYIDKQTNELRVAILALS